MTNIATPVGEAYADSSPVLVVASSGEQRTAGQMAGNLHDLRDQRGLMEHLTAWTGRATAPEQIPPLLAEAFRQMTTGRPRPAYVKIPLDVLGAKDKVEIVASESDATAPPPVHAVSAALDLIEGTERVVIYCGGERW